MAEHNRTGERGEQVACEYLKEHGLRVLHQNWRNGRDEVDIVAETNERLVFVEVKTRHGDQYGDPEVSVTKRKQRCLIRAADAYVNMFAVEKEVRFDVVSVIFEPGTKRILHIPEAFYPTL